jgi:hypothetical protein
VSTLKEIEDAIPCLSLREIQALRESLDRVLETAALPRARTIRDLQPLSGKWIGETVVRRDELADEMFDGK